MLGQFTELVACLDVCRWVATVLSYFHEPSDKTLGVIFVSLVAVVE